MALRIKLDDLFYWLNVNERNGEALSPEYGIGPAARNEFSPSHFVFVYARVWRMA
jgi:hypothetical protein